MAWAGIAVPSINAQCRQASVGRAILPAADLPSGLCDREEAPRSRPKGVPRGPQAMIGRPTGQPNCHCSVRDYLYDVPVRSAEARQPEDRCKKAFSLPT